MAKTRIKTTPTRMQKDALMASAATTTAAISKPVVATTCHTVAPLDDVKKRLRHSTAPLKLSQNLSGGTSTIIVTAPKRTNSISSITSTISQISDMNSDTESPPPPIVLTTSTTPTPTPTPTAASTTATKSTRSLLNTTHVAAPAPRTLNSLLCKPSTNITTTTSQHPAALRNRKVFMITEKTDEYAGVEASTSTAASGLTTGQKRKMYLIMEENSCGAEDGGEEYGEGEDTISRDAQKYLKRENGLIAGAGGTKKLTLFADKADSGTLTEKFEKILPEILNRIQAKETNGVGGGGGGAATAVLAYDAPLPAIATTVTSKILNGSANLNIIKSEPLSQQHQQQHKQQQQQQQPQLQLKQEPYNNKKTTDEKPANERLPITLPPKKNRTKIITTNYNGNSFASNFSDNFNKSTNNVWTNFGNSSNNNANNNNNNSTQKLATPPGQVKQISAATPVIVSAVTLNARQHHQSNNNNNNSSSSNKNNNNSTTNHTHNGNNNNSTCEIKRLAGKATNNNNGNSNNIINNTITTTTTAPPTNTNIRYVSHANGGSSSQVGGVVTTMAQVELVPQKNINLSTDFHFLIKMLPKLESIPEPHKNNVKNCIEKIITQNANIFAKQ